MIGRDRILYKDPSGIHGYIHGNAEYGTWTEVELGIDPTYAAPIQYQHVQYGVFQTVKLGLFPSPSDLDAGELGPIIAVIMVKTGNYGYAPDSTRVAGSRLKLNGGRTSIRDSVLVERLNAAARGIAERFFNRDIWWDDFTKDWSADQWIEYERAEAVD